MHDPTPPPPLPTGTAYHQPSKHMLLPYPSASAPSVHPMRGPSPTPCPSHLQGMFYSSSFNQDLSGWDVSSGTSFEVRAPLPEAFDSFGDPPMPPSCPSATLHQPRTSTHQPETTWTSTAPPAPPSSRFREQGQAPSIPSPRLTPFTPLPQTIPPLPRATPPLVASVPPLRCALLGSILISVAPASHTRC